MLLVRRMSLTLAVLALLPDCSASPSGSTSSAPAAGTSHGDYEFIVVGSGAGGGVVASRLARSGKRVLLVEAGDDVGGSTKYDVPAMHALATEDPAMSWWFFVSHHADASIDREDSKWTNDGILYPRGSALGGSTAVNAMVTVLPSRSDWNRLATLTGDGSFRADAMDRYYDRVREWLSVEIPDPSLALGDATVTAQIGAATRAYDDTSSTSLVSLLTRDVNDALRRGETTGVFRLPLATKDGKRNGPRELVQDTVAKGFPLDVMTGTFVTHVTFDGTRATGVEVVKKSGVYGARISGSGSRASSEDVPTAESIHASREVILSAGSFNTPQLLMLSGVGPQASLDKLGIETIADRPGVGENLQDRVEAAVVSELSEPLGIVSRCKLGASADEDPCLSDWERGAKSAVYRTPGFLASALVRSTPDVPLADLQIFAVPTDARGYYPGYSADSARAKSRFSWLLLKAHTKNHDGVVSLRDASPFSRPSIAFNSFDERDPEHDPDLRAVVEGIHFVRRLNEHARDLQPSVTQEEVWPGPERATDDDLARFVRREAWGHHACCTSRMGTADDDHAVVDSAFRVIGTTGLRVVDASVFPEIPGTFIALPTYMIAEKAADTIVATAELAR